MEEFGLFDYLMEREMQQRDALMDNLEATLGAALDTIVKYNRFVETYAALLKELNTALSAEETPSDV